MFTFSGTTVKLGDGDDVKVALSFLGANEQIVGKPVRAYAATDGSIKSMVWACKRFTTEKAMTDAIESGDECAIDEEVVVSNSVLGRLGISSKEKINEAIEANQFYAVVNGANRKVKNPKFKSAETTPNERESWDIPQLKNAYRIEED